MIGFLVEHGPLLLLGSTVVLAGGWLARRFAASVVDRHRLGVWTALATLAFLLLAVAPLPRWSWPEKAPATAPLASAAPTIPAAIPLPQVDPALRIAALQYELDALLDPAEATPTPVVATERVFHLSLPATVTLLYALGAALVLLRAGAGLCRLGLLLRRSTAAPAELLAALDLTPATRVRVLPSAVRPFCCALLRPTIVIPSTLLAPARRAELAAVLRHEAAHLRHRDPLTQLLLAVLAVPLWCHPLLWQLTRELRFLGELRADDAAAAEGRTAYARALLDLADDDLRTPRVAGTVAVFHKPSDFFRRMQMLLQRQGRLRSESSRAGRFAHAALLLSLSAGAAGLFGAPASAQDPAGRTLRKENAALKDEIAALRAELDALRQMFEHVRADEARRAAANPSTFDPSDLRTHLNAMTSDAATKALIDQLVGAGNHPHRAVAPAKAADTPAADAPPGSAEQPQHSGLPGTTPMRSLAELLDRTAAANDKKREVHSHQETTRAFLPGEDGLPHQAVDLFVGSQTASTQPAMPTSTIDAIADLTTRCLDLRSEVEIQEADLEEMVARAEKGFETAGEVRRGKIRLQNQQRKLKIVMRLLDGEIEATQSEVARYEHALQAADGTGEKLQMQVQLQRAMARLDALRAVK